jgi:hypothetical protein
MKFPLQPIQKDEHGTPRFVENKLVRYLLDNGGLDLNKLCAALPPETCREDWEQLAQLIGYSLSGFGELSYVSDIAYEAADAMLKNKKLASKDAELKVSREKLQEARKHAKNLATTLFHIHPEDLHE